MARTNLRVFRVKHKLSQNEIAEKLGCVRSTYTAIENGKRNGKQNFWSTLQKTFDVPEVDMWELMKIDEE